MSDHRITWLEREVRRHKLASDGDGGTIRLRSEFVESVPDQDPKYECKCGETFEDKGAAEKHLTDDSSGS